MINFVADRVMLMVTKEEYEQAKADIARRQDIIDEYERQTLKHEFLSRFAASIPKRIAADFQEHKIVIALEYTNKSLTRIGLTDDDVMRDFVIVASGFDADKNGAHDEAKEGKQSKWEKGFAVRFADGKVIDCPNANQTMIEALRYMGLERVSQYIGRTFAGYRLVGKRERDPNTRKWQRQSDGWWIYINMSNDIKRECLKGVSEQLNIPLTIEEHCNDAGLFASEESITHAKHRGTGRAYFSLNGEDRMTMNYIVLSAVKQFVKQMPDATFEDIRQYFSSNLCRGMGIVASLEIIEQRKSKYSTEDTRWFLGEDEILTSGDGIRFAVCRNWKSEWNGALIKHLKEQLGWTIEAVE